MPNPPWRSRRDVLFGIGARFRRRRFDWFLRLADIRNDDRILDVGGTGETWEGSGLEKQVIVLNPLVPGAADRAVACIRGDGRHMDMFAEREFDIVFSNSVIEHVGDIDGQRRFAAEVRRIGRRYWVQTPNKHFPIEQHFIFPALQYLPRALQRQIVGWWPLSFAKALDLNEFDEACCLRLLSSRDMRELFPDAEILRERLLGFTKSLVAHTLTSRKADPGRCA